jgi:hypothetical protein
MHESVTADVVDQTFAGMHVQVMAGLPAWSMRFCTAAYL